MRRFPAAIVFLLFLSGCGDSTPEPPPVKIPNPWQEGSPPISADYVDLDSDHGEVWAWSGNLPPDQAAVDRVVRHGFVAGTDSPGDLVSMKNQDYPRSGEAWLTIAFPELEIETVNAKPVEWGWGSYEGVEVVGSVNDHPFRAELSDSIPGTGLARYEVFYPKTGQQHRFELAALNQPVTEDDGDGWTYQGNRIRLLFQDRAAWPLYQLIQQLAQKQNLTELPVDLPATSSQPGLTLQWGPEGELLAGQGYDEALDFQPLTGQPQQSDVPATLAGMRVAKVKQGFDLLPDAFQVDLWMDRPEAPGREASLASLRIDRANDGTYQIFDWTVEERGSEERNVLDQMYVQAAETRSQDYYERLFEADQAITKNNFDTLHEFASERLIKMPDPTDDPHYTRFATNPMTQFPANEATAFQVGKGRLVEKQFYRRNGITRRVFEVPVTVKAGDQEAVTLVRLVSNNGSRNPEYWLPQVDDFRPADGEEAPSYLEQIR